MNRTVFITGGARGIGKTLVDHLSSLGYEVVAPSREEMDLSDSESIANYLQNHSDLKVDILINNAGINKPEWIEEMTDKNIEDTIRINLESPIRLLRGLIGHMKEKKWGRIVNISSAFGIVARGKQVLYCSTKHGINGMTKALALELAPYNILVNSVCPGFAETEMVLRNPKEKIASIEADIPLGRLVKPEEIAHLVEFLISEQNTYMTGAEVVIDGGFSVK
ncbi:SDR family oxidoreductase [Candidatus Roizmanbacteria bacterium]|nr:MAG: SDR family oxidoreductase [Candidatus Roizmanbacteria bacterium]